MRAQRLSGISVVLVDDDVDSAELLEMLLEGSGATVRVAASGKAALELLDGFTPDVLLLDITLPDMDGYELLRKIRGMSSRLASVTAVAVTGNAGERNRAKAEAAGFSIHTTKPIDAEALIHLIARLAAPASSRAPTRTVGELDALLTRDGLPAVLRVLNARTSYRYTGLYRYERDKLVNVALVDRLDPTTTKGSDVPVETSFCWLVQRDRASFATSDRTVDARVAGLPIRADVRAYCGTLVRNADGTPFGSLCHFDHVQHAVSEAEMALLEQFAPILARHIAPDVF